MSVPRSPSSDEKLAQEIESLLHELDIDPMSIEIQQETGQDFLSAEPNQRVSHPSANEQGVIDIDKLLSNDKAAIDPATHAAQIALVQAHAKSHLATELERFRTEAEAQKAAELSRVENEAALLREAEVTKARMAAWADARDRVNSELERVRAEAEARKAAELSRVEIEAARIRAEADAKRAAELARIEREAAQLRATEISKARSAAEAEADARLAVEIKRVRAETERHSRAELSRIETESAKLREAEIAKARRAAEADAKAKLAAELARIQREVARIRDAEIAKARSTAEAEAEARLAAEIKRVRREADAERADLARIAHEATQQRETDIAKARRAAETEANARLAAELARVRAELQQETERVHAEANRRLEQEVARLRAEAERQVRAQMLQLLEAARQPHTMPEMSPFAAETETAYARQVALVPAVTRAPYAPSRSVFSDPVVAGRWEPEPVQIADGPPRWQKVAIVAAIVFLILSVAGTVWMLSSARRLVSSLANRRPPVESVDTPAPSIVQSSAPKPTGRRSGRPAGPRPTAAPIAPSPVAAAQNKDAAPGRLAVVSRIPLELFSEGRRIGTTEDRQVMLPPGRHRVEMINSRFNYHGEIAFDITSGQLTSYTVSLPSGRLRVRSAPGAEVWIEGRRVGAVPLSDISVPIGTREVVVRHPQFGERRQSVEVSSGAPTVVTLGLENEPAVPTVQ